MKTEIPIHIRSHEYVIVLLEHFPWNAIYRIGIGFMLLPLFSRISGNDGSAWYLALWFVSVLLALRLVPFVLRKALPFSPEVRAIWVKRRTMAKHFDSYQWRKLFWFGIGSAGYLVLSGRFSNMGSSLTVFCLIAGGAGVWIWQRKGISVI